MESTVEPSTWPLIWLLFVLLFMINPLPVMSRESRWWFVRKFGRVLTSGFHRVEVSEFQDLSYHFSHRSCGSVRGLLAWVCAFDGRSKLVDTTHLFRDQLCSLTFSLKGIYFVGCSYVVGFHFDQYKTCSEPGPWGLPFILGALPLIARFLQSIRRWWETCLIIHLINASLFFTSDIGELIDVVFRVGNILSGFYLTCFTIYGNTTVCISPRGSSIILNIIELKGSNYDSNLVLFCFFGTISSLYALSWVSSGVSHNKQ